MKPVKVKICGITRPEDARTAAEAGADYIGAILSPGYGRSVSPTQAAGYLREGDPGGPRDTGGPAAASGRTDPPVLVGVLVDPSAADAADAGRTAGAGVLQLHGHEPAELLRALREEGAWALWKAVRVEGPDDIRRAVDTYGDVADGLLVDGGARGERGGGRGVRFPWEVVAEVRDLIPPGLVLVTAGGLTPDTVAEAARVLRPDVVDVSSGVERRYGEKDPSRVRDFVEAARNAARNAGDGAGSVDGEPAGSRSRSQEP